MKTVELTAPLTRGRQDFAPGATLALPAALAGKLVNRGRARLSVTGGIDPALPVVPEAAPGGDE